MARPLKKGLDYFPHDVDASNDDKVEALQELYGAIGYCFFFKLLERIYKTDSGEFHLRVSDAETTTETIQILSKKCFCDSETFLKMLNTSLRLGLFDKENYENNGILTSNSIKERLNVVVRKRKYNNNKFQTDNCLVSVAETRSKVKESKVKESKVKESKEEKISDDSNESRDTEQKNKKFIKPAIEEIQTYCKERNNSIDAEYFYNWYESKNWMIGKNKMKDWRACIITWERKNNGTNSRSTGGIKHKSGWYEDEYPEGITL